jgi:hypothetical protein
VELHRETKTVGIIKEISSSREISKTAYFHWYIHLNIKKLQTKKYTLEFSLLLHARQKLQIYRQNEKKLISNERKAYICFRMYACVTDSLNKDL